MKQVPRPGSVSTKIFPPLDKDPYLINGTAFRVEREPVVQTDPLELRIKVYKDGQPERILITLVTLIEDLMWDQVTTVSST